MERLIAAAIVAASTAAMAQDVPSTPAQPIIIPSQSSVYNQNSVFLPTPPTVSGQDIVRSADGSSCQSSISSGGPYVDLGVIGSEDFYERSTAALYGRVVVPLGKRSKRIDCTKLYELEISRMRMEIELLRMGAMMGGGAMPASMTTSELGMPATTPTQGLETDVDIEEEPITGAVIGGGTSGPALIDPMELAPAPPEMMMAAVEIAEPPTSTAPTPQRVAVVSPAPAAIAAPPPGRKPEAARGPGTNVYYVQIGAFSSPERAWRALDSVGSGDQGGLRPFERGETTLYRAVLGPFSREVAMARCVRMGQCLVVSG